MLPARHAPSPAVVRFRNGHGLPQKPWFYNRPRFPNVRGFRISRVALSEVAHCHNNEREQEQHLLSWLS